MEWVGSYGFCLLEDRLKLCLPSFIGQQRQTASDVSVFVHMLLFSTDSNTFI